jgi:hypothetical protein
LTDTLPMREKGIPLKCKIHRESEGSTLLPLILLQIHRLIWSHNNRKCPTLKSSPLPFKAKPFKLPVITFSFRRDAQTSKKIKIAQSLFQLR